MPEHNVEMIKLLTTGPVLQLNRSKLLPKMFKGHNGPYILNFSCKGSNYTAITC